MLPAARTHTASSPSAQASEKGKKGAARQFNNFALLDPALWPLVRVELADGAGATPLPGRRAPGEIRHAYTHFENVWDYSLEPRIELSGTRNKVKWKAERVAAARGTWKGSSAS